MARSTTILVATATVTAVVAGTAGALAGVLFMDRHHANREAEELRHRTAAKAYWDAHRSDESVRPPE